jgi:cystathionine beta-lyase/cystathionine gamma-synthase
MTQANTTLKYLISVLKNMPQDWLNLTTHRLDIYTESKAKTQFLEELKKLKAANDASHESLSQLPTAYDYIRLGHPLSCVLEWAIADLHNLSADLVISFGSKITPILAILRANLLTDKATRILYTQKLPNCFDAEVIRNVYGYTFELEKVENGSSISAFEGSTIYISNEPNISHFDLLDNIDFQLNLHPNLGSILVVNDAKNQNYVNSIQHVRRRETVAMTPNNCLAALQLLINKDAKTTPDPNRDDHKVSVINTIAKVTGAPTKALVGSSGLSIQYAIMMGLIDAAQESHPGKAIRLVVPTNCYGGTNDQARRVAATLDHLEVVDLAVDGENDMVQSLETVLDSIAQEDAIAYIIAEIPTNPRVEVPDLNALKNTLAKIRTTNDGSTAIDPVFILDQTFCPNVLFLGQGEILSTVRAISYASGSKFPSGGKCTAGYCVGNQKAEALMHKIEQHLHLCDNEATDLQYKYLAEQLPSMNQRIADAYSNTREFVNFIKETLPTSKINFVSEELAKQGFTPSVFSLDLPTKGDSDAQREAYKRALNHKLINMMITQIPHESKYCVSYGQLKGCYWTIPATSTQGTTKEGDKDYIARVALSANMDLEKHKQVFRSFVKDIEDGFTT